MQLRRPLSFPALLLVLTGTAAASAALQYLWLFEETPLAFDIWGIAFIPALLAGWIPALALLRVDLRSTAAWRGMLGSVWLWLSAFLVPVLFFGGGVWWHAAGGGELDPDWRWITLALSALFDLPVMLILLAPLLLAQECGFRRLVAAQGGTGAAWRSLLSAFAWTAALTPLLLRIAADAAPERAAAWGVLLFGTGAFAYRLQHRGAVLPAAFAVLTTVTCAMLTLGCDIPELTNAVLGFDVESVAPFFPKRSPLHVLLPAAAGAGLLLASLFIRLTSTSPSREM